jgi:hypothetical protein
MKNLKKKLEELCFLERSSFFYEIMKRLCFYIKIQENLKNFELELELNLN